MRSRGHVRLECVSEVVYTDYMSWNPEGVTNQMPVLVHGPKQALNKCVVFVDGHETETVNHGSNNLAFVSFERAMSARERGAMLIEARDRRSQTVVARKAIDSTRTPWRLLPRINKPDCRAGEEIECAIRVWNQSKEAEEFQIRVAQDLIPVVGWHDRPKVWSDCLKSDWNWSSKSVRVRPQSISDEIEPFRFKSAQPGLYAIFSMAIRLSNTVYQHREDWRFSDHHQWHLLLVTEP